MQSHQMEYAIGTYQTKCDACGTTLYLKMDYAIELAPVDIVEVWTSDGVPGEVIDEKRGEKKARESELIPVDEDSVSRPPSKSKRGK
jgi:hypothetical protein